MDHFTDYIEKYDAKFIGRYDWRGEADKHPVVCVYSSPLSIEERKKRGINAYVALAGGGLNDTYQYVIFFPEFYKYFSMESRRCILQHEIGHIAEKEHNEKVANKYAIMHTSFAAWRLANEETRIFMEAEGLI